MDTLLEEKNTYRILPTSSGNSSNPQGPPLNPRLVSLWVRQAQKAWQLAAPPAGSPCPTTCLSLWAHCCARQAALFSVCPCWLFDTGSACRSPRSVPAPLILSPDAHPPLSSASFCHRGTPSCGAALRALGLLPQPASAPPLVSCGAAQKAARNASGQDSG